MNPRVLAWVFAALLFLSLAGAGMALASRVFGWPVCLGLAVVFSWALALARAAVLEKDLAAAGLLPAGLGKERGAARLWPPAVRRRLLTAASLELTAKRNRIEELTKTLERYGGALLTEPSHRRAAQEELGGVLRPVFVLFSDVRGFTRMTESLRPEETVEILNTLFTAFEKEVREQGGEINKYIGDAAFAYFRRPYGDPTPAVRNVLRAALRMQERFLFHAERIRVCYSRPVEIGLGIGVAAGEAILGNLGSARRMEFTLIGDTVNLASRLCGMAKAGEILVNEEMAALAEESFLLERLPEVEIKGKSGTHRPSRVVGERFQFSRGMA